MNCLTPIIVVIFSICIGIYSEKVNYENYRIYSVHLKNEKQVKMLQAVENSNNDFIFLTSSSTQIPTDIIVPPHKLSAMNAILNGYGWDFEIKADNLQKLIDEEQPEELRSIFGWEQYNDLASIYSWLDEQLEKYSNVLTNYDFGKSYENRTLRAVKLSYKKGNPTIFIESNIHAREWVTSATTTYILNEFLTSDDKSIRDLAENYDWIIVPVFNVDGFEFTHTTNRMWRKTLQPHGNCVGADPNRNFDFHHAEPGSSTNPCNEAYAGPTPFSEPETKALSEFIKSFDNLKLFLTFHSFSQLLMHPYGFSKFQKPKNYDDLYEIAEAATTALAERYGTKYRYGDIANTIYVASGSSVDWVYEKLNVSLAYTYEFRDKGRHGFLLPAKQIIPNSLEVLDSLVALVNKAKSMSYF